MTITTERPVERPASLDAVTRARTTRPKAWLRLAGPVVALAIAGAAVGRFLSVGSSDSTAPTPGAGRSSTAAGSAASPGLDALRVETERRPQDPAAWRDYGIAAVRDAVRTGDPGFYGVAARALGEADRLAPGDADVLAARAVLALSVHDFASALPLAEQAVAANPLSTAALAALVDSHVELGQYAEAEAALERLLDADPGVAAYARVSYLRQLRGDMDGAAIAMRQAVAAATGPERAVVLTYLGDISLESGAVGDADDAYRAALREVPGFVMAELGAARVLIARGALVEAGAKLDALVARSPQPAVAQLRGELALLTGSPVDAERAFDLVRANDRILRSQGVVTDLESALFNTDHGPADLALSEAQAAYDARRTVFTADALAWALLRSGRADDAVPLVEEALAGGITSPSVRVHAAAVFAAVGAGDRAREELAVAFGSPPWLALSARPVANELAASLGVETPAGWSA